MQINITTGTMIRALLLVFLAFLIYLVRNVMLLTLLSIVIASGVEPAAAWFQKRRVPRVLAVIIIYLVAFLTLGFMFYLVIPPVFSELSDLSANIPTYLEKPFQMKTIHEFLPELPESISQIILGFADSARSFIEKITGGFFHATSVLFGGALSFVFTIVLSFYLSVQEKGIENFLRMIIPLKYEEYAIDLWKRSRDKIGSWMKGQILLGLLIGVMVFLGLTILQVRYAISFAFLAAVFEIIPVFGPVMASIPPIGIALLQSPSLALLVAALFFVVQQFENHLIYPLVVRKVVGISPTIVILVLFIGGKLAGFLGIILAVPLATVLVEFLNDFEKKKRMNAHE
ncbi:MAG: AI-2E family transporter [Candidatus Paceibacterota bacterium]